MLLITCDQSFCLFAIKYVKSKRNVAVVGKRVVSEVF